MLILSQYHIFESYKINIYRALIKMCGVFLDANFHGGSNDTIGGWRYRRFIPINFLLSLAAPHLHGVLVLVTGDKFIAGVNDKFIPGINDTGDH